MDAGLQYLVHFFNDREHLFQTLTMGSAEQAEAICDSVSSQKGWFWPRFAPSERRAYLARRLFVEKEMYECYTQDYGPLKDKVPVYFYLYPGITPEGAMERGRQRAQHGERAPQVLIARVEDIPDIRNLTFTLNDSFAAYWKKAVEAGLEIRGDPKEHVVLPDHNRVFPFSMLERLYQKYKGQGHSYEIQVWDHQLLDDIRYTIL